MGCNPPLECPWRSLTLQKVHMLKALVIQSSGPVEAPKMPQGLVISELRDPEHADNNSLISKKLFPLLSAQTSLSSA